MKHLVIIDDDRDLRELLHSYYSQRKYQVLSYPSAKEALVDEDNLKNADAILCDLMMEEVNGLSFLSESKKIAQIAPVIMMTSSKEVDYAFKAMDSGAFDYAIKPLHFEQLSLVISRAVKFHELQKENNKLKSVFDKNETILPNMIGRSQALEKIAYQAKRVAKTTSSVLITGESGTGKDVLARAIHALSDRANKPFIAINCTAIPENLLESELFGHSKGSFTGALKDKIGLFEEANGGTLFLDEIGDMDIQLQSKLLRVLQERRIRKIGEVRDIEIDVRIISATHKNLSKLIQEAKFREDLFYRLNVIPLHVPSLRERPEDILPLATYFLKKFTALNKKEILSFSKDSLDFLNHNPWYGNIRELENTIERAVILCENGQIQLADLASGTSPIKKNMALPSSLSSPNEQKNHSPAQASSNENVIVLPALMTLDQVAKQYILFSLKRNNDCKEKTAKELKIDRKTLYRKLSEMRGQGPKSKIKEEIVSEENLQLQ